MLSRQSIEPMPTDNQCVSEAKNIKIPTTFFPSATAPHVKWLVIKKNVIKSRKVTSILRIELLDLVTQLPCWSKTNLHPSV